MTRKPIINDPATLTTLGSTAAALAIGTGLVVNSVPIAAATAAIGGAIAAGALYAKLSQARPDKRRKPPKAA